MTKATQAEIFKKAEDEARQMAATAATHGSPAMRTGRTDVPYLAEKRLAQRILAEAQAADRAWANWEAINQSLGPASSAAAALRHLHLGALGPIRDALARDAILIAFRLTDNVSADRLTLSRIVLLLQDEAQQQLFSSEQWALDLGYQPWAVEDAAKSNKARIERLSDLLLSDWSTAKRKPPKDKSLLDLRELLRPVRDKIIAHAIEATDITQPTISEIELLVRLTLDLATDAALLITGSAVAANDFRRFSRKQAVEFWSWAFKGPVEEYDAHSRKLGFAEE